MCLRQSQLPRKSRILDGASWSRSCSSVVSGDQDNACAGFRNTCRNRTDACFGDELDRDSCVLVRVFTVIDQLRQILDRVNVMVRRR